MKPSRAQPFAGARVPSPAAKFELGGKLSGGGSPATQPHPIFENTVEKISIE